jgi:hypothetical protein
MSLPGGGQWDEERNAGEEPGIFFLPCILQFSFFCSFRRGCFPEKGAGISGLYLEGARWYEELGRLVQSFSIVFFTFFYKILCSVVVDEAVPEEGAGVSALG